MAFSYQKVKKITRYNKDSISKKYSIILFFYQFLDISNLKLFIIWVFGLSPFKIPKCNTIQKILSVVGKKRWPERVILYTWIWIHLIFWKIILNVPYYVDFLIWASTTDFSLVQHHSNSKIKLTPKSFGKWWELLIITLTLLILYLNILNY